jgi:hypothetical protein
VSLSAQDISLESLDTLAGVEALCVFTGKEDRPLRGLAGLLDWRMCGGLSRLLVNDFFQGDEGEVLLFTTNRRISVNNVFVVGTGTRKPTSDGIGELLQHAAQTMKKAGVANVAIEVPGGGVLEDGVRAAALQNHFLPQFRGAVVTALGEKSFCRYLSAATKG